MIRALRLGHDEVAADELDGIVVERPQIHSTAGA
jgi:hypothetical protein